MWTGRYEPGLTREQAPLMRLHLWSALEQYGPEPKMIGSMIEGVWFTLGLKLCGHDLLIDLT